MDLSGANVLVTGANRGIGAAFVEQLKRRGANTIYAAARDAGSISAEGVVPLELDVTDADQIAAAAAIAGDLHVLINNAGISTNTPLVTGDEAAIRREMETNFYGPLRLTRAFAPILKANGGGAIVNVASAVSWFSAPNGGAYAASKAAVWALSDSTRIELAAQGTHVVSVHMGLVDTDMTKEWDAPKVSASSVAGAALDAVGSGAQEVLADDWAAFIKSGLVLDPEVRYEQIAAAMASMAA